MLTSRGLGAVLGDLATMGFDAKWGVLGAADVGANHQRDRIWIRGQQRAMANPMSTRQWWNKWESQNEENVDGEITNSNRIGLQEPTNKCQLESQRSNQLQVEQPRDSSQVANTERMGWKERASKRGESQNQETSSQLDNRSQTSGAGENASYTKCSGLEGWQDRRKQEITWTRGCSAPIGTSDWWSVEPNVDRVAHGVAARMERIKAIGNGQVPLCAATAWRVLK